MLHGLVLHHHVGAGGAVLMLDDGAVDAVFTQQEQAAVDLCHAALPDSEAVVAGSAAQEGLAGDGTHVKTVRQRAALHQGHAGEQAVIDQQAACASLIQVDLRFVKPIEVNLRTLSLDVQRT